LPGHEKIKTTELAIEGDHPAMRVGKTYTFDPVFEEDELLGYVVHNAETGAFVMFVTDDEVRTGEP
jgi:hypothetical protein